MSALRNEVDVMSSVPGQLLSYIATRDKRIAKAGPIVSPTMLLDSFATLLRDGVVRFGGRATCGTYKDPTWTQFQLWNEVVRKARQLGFEITETNIKQNNGWATKAGGFWNESEYRLSIEAKGAASHG